MCKIILIFSKRLIVKTYNLRKNEFVLSKISSLNIQKYLRNPENKTNFNSIATHV